MAARVLREIRETTEALSASIRCVEEEGAVSLEWFKRPSVRKDAREPESGAPLVFLDTMIMQYGTAERWTTVMKSIRWGGRISRSPILTARPAKHPPHVMEEVPHIRQIADLARDGKIRLCTSIGNTMERKASLEAPWLDNAFLGLRIETLHSPWSGVVASYDSKTKSLFDETADPQLTRLRRSLEKMDAFHVRCAIERKVDYFVTTDRPLIRMMAGWKSLNLSFLVLLPSELTESLKDQSVEPHGRS